MPTINDYITKHPQGGEPIVGLYGELEQALVQYQSIVSEMQGLHGTGDWVLPHVSRGRVVAVELVDGDEPFIGSMGNAMMQQVEAARSRMQVLMMRGWGNLPLVKEFYGKIMQESFPENYNGIEIPSEYDTIDAKFTEIGPKLLKS